MLLSRLIFGSFGAPPQCAHRLLQFRPSGFPSQANELSNRKYGPLLIPQIDLGFFAPLMRQKRRYCQPTNDQVGAPNLAEKSSS
jgi:hypothetical protein